MAERCRARSGAVRHAFNQAVASLVAPDPNWQIASIEFVGFANTVVPEPSTYALMATGLVGLVGIARRRSRNSLRVLPRHRRLRASV